MAGVFKATAESRILLYFSYLNEPKILEGALIPADIAGTDTNQISHFRNHFWACVFIRSSDMLFNALSGYEASCHSWACSHVFLAPLLLSGEQRSAIDRQRGDWCVEAARTHTPAKMSPLIGCSIIEIMPVNTDQCQLR